MTETGPKQTEGPALPPLLSSLYFNLFLSHSPPTPASSPPLPLSVSVSPCYVSLPYVVRPSSAFSLSPPPPTPTNVPTEADLMDDPCFGD